MRTNIQTRLAHCRDALNLVLLNVSMKFSFMFGVAVRAIRRQCHKYRDYGKVSE